MFTLNNYTDEEMKELEEYMEAKCVYGTYGMEVGEEKNTPHLQCFLYYKNKRTWNDLKKLCNGRLGRIQVVKSLQDAIDYCHKGEQSKEEWKDLKTEGPNFGKNKAVFEVGERPIGAVGKKCTLEERATKNKKLWKESLIELVESGEVSISQVPVLKKARLILEQEGEALTTEDVRGTWIYGPPGTGKSHYARTTFGDSLYLKAQNKWFCGYSGERNILLDDFDTNILGHYLKIWADKWACTGEVKGGKVNLRHENFVITSNYSIAELWPGEENKALRRAIERRFVVKKMLVKYNKKKVD
jgi:hypothetical protein